MIGLRGLGATGAHNPDYSISPLSGLAEPARPTITANPLIGTLGVLLGSVIATLDSRISSFGLADVEGAVHAGFDEGAWITTALSVGQMLVGPVSPWLGATFGVRRVLMLSCVIFSISNLLLPLSPNLAFVLGFQVISGAASGTFIPLTIGFVIQNLPRRLVVYGIAAYAMNLELSLNIAASIEGWFDAHWSWQWIFWDTALLAPLMMVCIYFGVPRQAVNRAQLMSADWPGIAFLSGGLCMIFAALDQGNRLDWLSSGLIIGLLSGGAVLIAAFFVHEATTKNPWIHLGYALRGNLPLFFFNIALFRSVLLSTSYLIPQYLITVQNYRALEVGSVLIWIAMPQFLIAPIVATVLRFVDARITQALGYTLIGAACFMAAQLTGDWASDEFIPSQIMQAVGQSVALTSLVWFSLKFLVPADALTFGAILQTGRLFGSEIGTGFVTTFVRVREQMYSNLVGLHVISGAPSTTTRLQDYSHAVSDRSIGAAAAGARATVLLADAVRKQAYVLAYIDAFMVLGFATMAALVLMLVLRDPPKDSVFGRTD